MLLPLKFRKDSYNHLGNMELARITKTIQFIIPRILTGGTGGKEPAFQCIFLAWRIPLTEEPDELQSIGSQRAGHTEAFEQDHTYII